MTPQTLNRLAEFCSLAYQSDKAIKAQLPGVQLWHNSGADAFSFREGNRAFVVVRGTADSYDWISNTKTTRVGFDLGGQVHAGFDQQARQLFMVMFDWIRKAKEDGCELCFGGHSLGSAVSTILAAKCLYRSLRIDGILAMCAPRIGDATFVKALETRLGANWIRTQLCRDIVARVPPPWFGFRHGGKHVYFDRQGECHIYPNLSYQIHDRFMDTITDFVKGRFARGWVDDHSANINTNLIRQHSATIVRTVTIEEMEPKLKTTNLRTRIAPGDKVTLTVTEEIKPGQQLVIEFGNGGRAARENTFRLPESVKFEKTTVDTAE
jgi:hypothetical protein